MAAGGRIIDKMRRLDGGIDVSLEKVNHVPLREPTLGIWPLNNLCGKARRVSSVQGSVITHRNRPITLATPNHPSIKKLLEE